MHQGDNFTSNQLVTFFVGGLQRLPRWEQFVLNLRQKENLPSLDEVMSLARDEHRLHKALGSTPDTAIVLSAQSTKRSKKPYHTNRIGHCTIHPRSSHTDEDCFVQHPEKKHDRATKSSGSVADPRATMFSISTPVHTLSAVTSSSLWAVDSGANEHCCNTSQLLFNVQPISPPVTIHGVTGAYTCTLQGSLQLDLSLPKGGVQLITLSRVLYVPDLPINLLSSNHFRAKGVCFSNLDCTFRRVSDNKPFGHAPIHNGLNILQLAQSRSTAPTPVGLLASFEPRSTHKDSSARSTALSNGIAALPPSTVSPIPSPPDRASPVTSRSDDQADLWHRRLGHPGITTMRTIQAATPGLPHVPFKQLQPCEVCQLAKSTRTVSRTPQRRARQPLEKIHVDLIGRIQPQSSQGHNYVTVITDDYSRYRWTFSTPVKGDAHQTVVNFVQWTQVHCSPFHIQVIRIDQGKEFGVTAIRTLCERESIDLEYSAAYTPEQNGIAEASNKVLLTKARAMMLDSGLPQRMWNEALVYATCIVNRSITQRSQLASPYQMFWQAIRNDETKNDRTHLRRFGCAVYYHRPSSQTVKSEKFAARAIRGYLLGMQADSATNYRIWLTESQTILHTPHVTFDETASYRDHVEHKAERTGNNQIQITGPNTSAIETLRDGLKATFTLKELEARTFLGLQIERDLTKRCLHLHQTPYAEKVLQDFGFRNSKAVATPMLEHSFVPHEAPVDPSRQRWYRQAVGSLNYLAVSTRPDLAFSISRLSRYLDNPSSQHEVALKRVFRYLNGTIGHGLTFQARESEPFVYGYSDADWAGDVETRKSTSGYAFFVAGGLVSWKTRLQSVVTLSSTEAEYAALAAALREAAWLRCLLTEIGIEQAKVRPLPIFEDNQSAIKLATNHANSNRTKHIDVRNHYCRQEHNMGHVTIEYVPTDSQVADGFTKPLGSTKWKHFVSLLRLAQLSPNNPKTAPAS